jgi:hypothetical protein
MPGGQGRPPGTRAVSRPSSRSAHPGKAPADGGLSGHCALPPRHRRARSLSYAMSVVRRAAMSVVRRAGRWYVSSIGASTLPAGPSSRAATGAPGRRRTAVSLVHLYRSHDVAACHCYGNSASTQQLWPGDVSSGSIRAALPRNCGNSRYILSLYSRDHSLRAILRAGSGNRCHILRTNDSAVARPRDRPRAGRSLATDQGMTRSSALGTGIGA